MFVDRALPSPRIFPPSLQKWVWLVNMVEQNFLSFHPLFLPFILQSWYCSQECMFQYCSHPLMYSYKSEIFQIQAWHILLYVILKSNDHPFHSPELLTGHGWSYSDWGPTMQDVVPVWLEEGDCVHAVQFSCTSTATIFYHTVLFESWP